MKITKIAGKSGPRGRAITQADVKKTYKAVQAADKALTLAIRQSEASIERHQWWRVSNFHMWTSAEANGHAGMGLGLIVRFGANRSYLPGPGRRFLDLHLTFLLWTFVVSMAWDQG